MWAQQAQKFIKAEPLVSNQLSAQITIVVNKRKQIN